MSPKLQLIIAAIFGLISISIWLVFLRPVPTKSAVGVIRNKQFKPAGEYTQQHAGQRSGFYAPTRIPIAECYIFEIQVEGWPEMARAALNTVAAQGFEVGQPANIEYQERGVPLIWKRVYVMKMSVVK